MIRRPIRTARVRSRFLEALRATCSVTQACRAVQVGRSSVYDWRSEDAQFRAEWDNVIEEIIEAIYAKMLVQARDDDSIAGVSARRIVLKAHKPELFHPGWVLQQELMRLEIEKRRAELARLAAPVVEGQLVPATAGEDGTTVINNVEIVPARRFRLPDNGRGEPEAVEDEAAEADAGDEPPVIEERIANAAD